MECKWWQKAVVYQIYPKSFYDSNGDGIGDLRGIIKKLNYISDLGIDVIWLSPIYSSPMADNGYDISDYKEIDKRFGTMEDLDELISEAGKRNIKIVMDLVVNHTSDEHQWFIRSRSSKDSPYRDYYYWKGPKADGGPPNNWRSIFGGSVWEYDEKTGEYYLHVFAKKQPDLNWENPRVRKEVSDIVRWWLDKGIGGFRVDAITFIKKDLAFKDVEADGIDGLGSVTEGSLNMPGIHEFLDELNRDVFSKYDIMTVAEAPGVEGDEIKKYIGENGHFSMIFDFSYTDIDLDEAGGWTTFRDWKVSELKERLDESQIKNEEAGWGAVFLENHDLPRCLNKLLSDEGISEKGAKMLGGMYFFLRGTPYIYQGQEIGMTNVRYDSIEDYDDISSIDQYETAIKNGLSEKEALEVLWKRSRDNSRTPMQWDSSPNAGFTKGEPWLKVNSNYKEVNVEKAIKDEGSIYSFYKKLIKLRKSSAYEDVIVLGSYVSVKVESENVIAYERVLGNKRIAVFANMREHEESVKVGFKSAELIISNDEYMGVKDGHINLPPYGFFVLDII